LKIEGCLVATMVMSLLLRPLVVVLLLLTLVLHKATLLLFLLLLLNKAAVVTVLPKVVFVALLFVPDVVLWTAVVVLLLLAVVLVVLLAVVLVVVLVVLLAVVLVVVLVVLLLAVVLVVLLLAVVGGGAPPPAGRAHGSGPRFQTMELPHLNEAILDVLPLGPEEWERVADKHHNNYPHFNHCSNSLKQKFKEMYSQTVPTGGGPECPEHVRTAKRLHKMILECSDADNLEGPEVDLGVEEEENEGNDEGGQEGVGGTARQLFPGTTAARPFVRTPVSGRRSTNGGVSDLTAVVLGSLASTNRNEEAEREERHQERRMNQMFMIGMLSAMNPAAAAAMQPIQNQLLQQMQNDLTHDDNLSSNN
jgi:hypothetical protein